MRRCGRPRLQRRLLFGLSVEDAQSKFNTPESRAQLQIAHERYNKGVFHELQQAQRLRQQLSSSQKLHITRHTKPSTPGFQAYATLSADDFVVQELCWTRKRLRSASSREGSGEHEDGMGERGSGGRRAPSPSSSPGIPSLPFLESRGGPSSLLWSPSLSALGGEEEQQGGGVLFPVKAKGEGESPSHLAHHHPTSVGSHSGRGEVDVSFSHNFRDGHECTSYSTSIGTGPDEMRMTAAGEGATASSCSHHHHQNQERGENTLDRAEQMKLQKKPTATIEGEETPILIPVTEIGGREVLELSSSLLPPQAVLNGTLPINPVSSEKQKQEQQQREREEQQRWKNEEGLGGVRLEGEGEEEMRIGPCADVNLQDEADLDILSSSSPSTGGDGNNIREEEEGIEGAAPSSSSFSPPIHQDSMEAVSSSSTSSLPSISSRPLPKGLTNFEQEQRLYHHHLQVILSSLEDALESMLDAVQEELLYKRHQHQAEGAAGLFSPLLLLRSSAPVANPSTIQNSSRTSSGLSSSTSFFYSSDLTITDGGPPALQQQQQQQGEEGEGEGGDVDRFFPSLTSSGSARAAAPTTTTTAGMLNNRHSGMYAAHSAPLRPSLYTAASSSSHELFLLQQQQQQLPLVDRLVDEMVVAEENGYKPLSHLSNWFEPTQLRVILNEEDEGEEEEKEEQQIHRSSGTHRDHACSEKNNGAETPEMEVGAEYVTQDGQPLSQEEKEALWRQREEERAEREANAKRVNEAFNSPYISIPVAGDNISYSLYVAGGLIKHPDLIRQFPYHIARFFVSTATREAGEAHTAAVAAAAAAASAASEVGEEGLPSTTSMSSSLSSSGKKKKKKTKKKKNLSPSLPPPPPPPPSPPPTAEVEMYFSAEVYRIAKLIGLEGVQTLRQFIGEAIQAQHTPSPLSQSILLNPLMGKDTMSSPYRAFEKKSGIKEDNRGWTSKEEEEGRDPNAGDPSSCFSDAENQFFNENLLHSILPLRRTSVRIPWKPILYMSSSSSSSTSTSSHPSEEEIERMQEAVQLIWRAWGHLVKDLHVHGDLDFLYVCIHQEQEKEETAAYIQGVKEWTSHAAGVISSGGSGAGSGAGSLSPPSSSARLVNTINTNNNNGGGHPNTLSPLHSVPASSSYALSPESLPGRISKMRSSLPAPSSTSCISYNGKGSFIPLPLPSDFTVIECVLEKRGLPHPVVLEDIVETLSMWQEESTTMMRLAVMDEWELQHQDDREEMMSAGKAAAAAIAEPSPPAAVADKDKNQEVGEGTLFSGEEMMGIDGEQSLFYSSEKAAPPSSASPNALVDASQSSSSLPVPLSHPSSFTTSSSSPALLPLIYSPKIIVSHAGIVERSSAHTFQRIRIRGSQLAHVKALAQALEEEQFQNGVRGGRSSCGKMGGGKGRPRQGIPTEKQEKLHHDGSGKSSTPSLPTHSHGVRRKNNQESERTVSEDQLEEEEEEGEGADEEEDSARPIPPNLSFTPCRAEEWTHVHCPEQRMMREGQHSSSFPQNWNKNNNIRSGSTCSRSTTLLSHPAAYPNSFPGGEEPMRGNPSSSSSSAGSMVGNEVEGWWTPPQGNPTMTDEEREFWRTHYYRLRDIKLVYYDRVEAKDVLDRRSPRYQEGVAALEWKKRGGRGALQGGGNSSGEESTAVKESQQNSPGQKMRDGNRKELEEEEEEKRRRKTVIVRGRGGVVEGRESNCTSRLSGGKTTGVKPSFSAEQVFQQLCASVEKDASHWDLLPGDCPGYQYHIRLRKIRKEETPLVRTALKSVQQKGFINYFTPHRFSSFTQMGRHPGLALLKGEFHSAASMMVQQALLDAALKSQREQSGHAPFLPFPSPLTMNKKGGVSAIPFHSCGPLRSRSIVPPDFPSLHGAAHQQAVLARSSPMIRVLYNALQAAQWLNGEGMGSGVSSGMRSTQGKVGSGFLRASPTFFPTRQKGGWKEGGSAVEAGGGGSLLHPPRHSLIGFQDGEEEEDPCAEAFRRVLGPHVCRVLIHEFLAFVWNDLVNQRIQRYGTFTVLPGDVVRVPIPLQDWLPSSTIVDMAFHSVEGMAKGSMNAPPHRAVGVPSSSSSSPPPSTSPSRPIMTLATREGIAQHRFHWSDVILPVPGSDVVLPQNHTADLYVLTLKRHGIPFNPEKGCWEMFSAGGSRRDSDGERGGVGVEGRIKGKMDRGGDLHQRTLPDSSSHSSRSAEGSSSGLGRTRNGNALGLRIPAQYRSILVHPMAAPYQFSALLHPGVTGDPFQRWGKAIEHVFTNDPLVQKTGKKKPKALLASSPSPLPFSNHNGAAPSAVLPFFSHTQQPQYSQCHSKNAGSLKASDGTVLSSTSGAGGTRSSSSSSSTTTTSNTATAARSSSSSKSRHHRLLPLPSFPYWYPQHNDGALDLSIRLPTGVSPWMLLRELTKSDVDHADVVELQEEEVVEETRRRGDALAAVAGGSPRTEAGGPSSSSSSTSQTEAERWKKYQRRRLFQTRPVATSLALLHQHLFRSSGVRRSLLPTLRSYDSVSK